MNSYAEAKRVPTEQRNTRIVSVNSKLRMLWPIYYFQVRNEAKVLTMCAQNSIIGFNCKGHHLQLAFNRYSSTGQPLN